MVLDDECISYLIYFIMYEYKVWKDIKILILILDFKFFFIMVFFWVVYKDVIKSCIYNVDNYFIDI